MKGSGLGKGSHFLNGGAALERAVGGLELGAGRAQVRIIDSMEPRLEAPPDSATVELVRRVQAGDGEAWTELYRVYRDELLFFVRTRMGAGLRATMQTEDVFQSVALEAFRELPRFEPRGEGSLMRFLHVLVLNKLRDLADRSGAAKRAGGVALTEELQTSLAAGGGELAYADPAYERLETAIGHLPADMREVLVLRRIEGRSSQEVAALLGKSDDAVRKLHSRAMAKLALELGAGGGI